MYASPERARERQGSVQDSYIQPSCANCKVSCDRFVWFYGRGFVKFLQAHCPITFISVLGWEVWDLRGIIRAFKCDGSTEKRRVCLGKKNKLIGRSLIGKVKAFLSCIYFRKMIFSSFFPLFLFWELTPSESTHVKPYINQRIFIHSFHRKLNTQINACLIIFLLISHLKVSILAN